jgi:hypothetical protein
MLCSVSVLGRGHDYSTTELLCDFSYLFVIGSNENQVDLLYWGSNA